MASLRGETPPVVESPDTAQAWWLRARNLSETAQWGESVTAYDNALKAAKNAGREPYLGWTLEVRRGKGQALLAARRNKEALIEFAVLRSYWDFEAAAKSAF